MGRSVKGAIRIMLAKGVEGLGRAAGAMRSFGRCGERGLEKYRALAAVTAVPRLWPRSTVRLGGWLRVVWM